jgi:glutamate 5-kinase
MAMTVIKLGSSIVADDRGDPRVDVIRHVCEETARLHEEGSGVALVTSGAIARGMRAMGLAVRPRSIDDLQAASAVGQAKLFRVYEELLAERQVPSAQVLLTFFDLSARTHYLNARRTLRKLVEWGVVPVINENDTTATDEISFGDNDFLAAQVAILLDAERLLLLTDIDGLYTADPSRDPGARLVPEVEDLAELERLEIGAAASPLGSGGMRSKVVAAEMATSAGIPATILDGTVPGPLARALAGERVGTRFKPMRGRMSSFKLWLRYAKPSHGRLLVDRGAADALRERGTSLLPVGIVGVEGDFRAGDAIEVAAREDGGGDAVRLLGKGLVNYSAAELRRVRGMKTAEVARLLPRASAEAVHRDYFVLD